MMAETSALQPGRQRLTIRLGRGSLSFSAVSPTDGKATVVFEPYAVRSGISMAANLREALRGEGLPSLGFRRALVMVDAPALVVPVDLYVEGESEALYFHSFPGRQGEAVLSTVVPDLNAVAVFSVSKDLKTVVDDHFGDALFGCAVAPVWRHLYQRSFTGPRSKLYGYFHDERVDIFSFGQGRFKFCNAFDTRHASDALYFLMYVWKQLMLKAEHDELHLVGDIPEREWIIGELRRFLQRAYVINPVADFNRSPASLVEGMPYDLMTLYTKGR